MKNMHTHTTKNLAIIPARGGSKRLPGKNIKEVNGKPLICYTIEAAIKSGCFDTILFSSDSEEILSVANEYKKITIDLRPDSLAGDKVKVIDAVCEIADRDEFQGKFDTISLLLPTCPFRRRATDIQNGFELLDRDIDSVISATNFDFPIRMSFEIDRDTQELQYIFDPSPLVTGNTRSQDHTPTYRPNGAFYISWWTNSKEQELLPGKGQRISHAPGKFGGYRRLPGPPVCRTAPERKDSRTGFLDILFFT